MARHPDGDNEEYGGGRGSTTVRPNSPLRAEHKPKPLKSMGPKRDAAAIEEAAHKQLGPRFRGDERRNSTAWARR